MSISAVIGLVAGTLTTLAFVPQVIKTWRIRSVGDVSLGMYVVFALGVFLWICYGVAIDSLPVVAANVATFVLACVMIVFSIRFR